jgi:hypothetical protein
MKMANPLPVFAGGEYPTSPFWVELSVLDGVLRGSCGEGGLEERASVWGLSGDCINHYKANSIVIFKPMN